MHACLHPAAPAPMSIDCPPVSLTGQGARLLALLACRELLPASSITVAAVLDRRIDALLGGDSGAD